MNSSSALQYCVVAEISRMFSVLMIYSHDLARKGNAIERLCIKMYPCMKWVGKMSQNLAV